jgi:hypothetical protein
MTNKLFFIAILSMAVLAVSSPALRAENTTPEETGDPIRKELDAAKNDYQYASAEAKLSLLTAVDDKIKVLAATGNLDATKALTDEKQALETDGKLPTSKAMVPAVTKFSRSTEQARSVLSRAYDKAIKSYTKELRLKDAEALRKEMAGIISSGSTGSNRTIDLLAMIDTKRDVVAGKWQLTAEGLISDNRTEWSRIRIPFAPPEEYDFCIEFERVAGENGPVQLVNSAKCSVTLLIAGGNQVTGFERVHGLNIIQNNKHISHKIENNKKYLSILRVRKDSVSVIFDGKTLLAANPADCEIHEIWRFDPEAVGVGSNQSLIKYTKIWIVEVSGRGKSLISK